MLLVAIKLPVIVTSFENDTGANAIIELLKVANPPTYKLLFKITFFWKFAIP